MNTAIIHAAMPIAMVGLWLTGRPDMAIFILAMQGATYIIANAIRDRS